MFPGVERLVYMSTILILSRYLTWASLLQSSAKRLQILWAIYSNEAIYFKPDLRGKGFRNVFPLTG